MIHALSHRQKNIRARLARSAFVWAALLTATFSYAREELADRIVAVVDGRAITYCEIETEARLQAVYEGLWAELQDERINLEMRESILRLLIFKALASNEAAKLNIYDVPPSEVKKAVASIRGKFNSAIQYQNFLVSADLTEEELESLLERDLRVDRFLTFRLRSYERVTDYEIRDYYEKNKKQFAGRSFDAVKKLIRGAIIKQRLIDQRRQWMDAALARAKILIMEDGLKPGPSCLKRE